VRLHQVLAVAAVDLRRLLKSRDYLVPLTILAGMFFVVFPLVALGLVGAVDRTPLMSRIGDVIGTLPARVQEQIVGDTPATRTAYGLAVYLFAPIAIVVPLTISSAVGANIVVGEREQGTGEFLAHSPLTVREIYLGKLVASLVPGYVATAVGFTLYSLVVNLTVGRRLGGWFFPTAGWLLLIVWVVPPFIAVALAVILRVSARVRSAAAAQQASTLVTLPVIVASYAISSGLLYSPAPTALAVGSIAWVLALVLLRGGGDAVRRDRLLGVADPAGTPPRGALIGRRRSAPAPRRSAPPPPPGSTPAA